VTEGKRKKEGYRGREWRQKFQINKIRSKEWWVCFDPAKGGDEGTS
jgi:hypothetical protein